MDERRSHCEYVEPIYEKDIVPRQVDDVVVAVEQVASPDESKL